MSATFETSHRVIFCVQPLPLKCVDVSIIFFFTVTMLILVDFDVVCLFSWRDFKNRFLNRVVCFATVQ